MLRLIFNQREGLTAVLAQGQQDERTSGFGFRILHPLAVASDLKLWRVLREGSLRYIGKTYCSSV